ncbi:hypothetical protein [Micromonospora marina]|uniref:hypothetical protein n=1 Tax=Micromonospora marina TaxID=307120 RepID=UPI003454E07B
MTVLVPHREPDPHDLLLRLAGRLPDELSTECRRWLSQGLDADVVQAVQFALQAGDIAITTDDAARLRTLLAAAGHDPGAADAIRVDDTPTRYGAAPVAPAVLASDPAAVPYTIDLTEPHQAAFGPDALDDVAVTAVRAAQADAVWRGWRFPPPGQVDPPPRRVYLVLAAWCTAADLASITARTQDALLAAGERNPQVEVFAEVEELPHYQRHALEFAALLWAAEPARPIRIAPAEPAPPTAPAARLDDAERDLVLAYLDSGCPLLGEEPSPADAPDDRRVTAWRTDGAWIWTNLAGDDLRRHDVAPAGPLLAHIREHDHRLADLSYVSVHRALSRLYLHGLAG